MNRPEGKTHPVVDAKDSPAAGRRRRLVLLLALFACACRETTNTAADPAFAEFQRRIDAYMKIHDDVERGSGTGRITADPAELQQRREELRAALQKRRADARQGDIFTPEVAAAFRTALNPEVRGAAAADTRTAIRDGAPREFTLAPNAPYPDEAPYATIPASVLSALPELPPHLEYRIVTNDLILLDVHANVVVDYIYDVMCAKC